MISFSASPLGLQAVVLCALFILIAASLTLLIIQCFRRAKAYAAATSLALLLLLMADALLLEHAYVAQAAGCVVAAPGRWTAALPVALHMALISSAALWCILGLGRERTLQKTAITPSSIREALDNLPSGLCLATQGGMPVLTNRRMYALAAAITGGRLVNADLFWRELTAFRDRDGVRRTDYAGTLAFHLPDGGVWRFAQRGLEAGGVRYVQITATEITRLWDLSRELEQDNRKLDAQQKRLQKLLRNIAQIRQAEEILSSKMQLHDRLGRAVLTSRRYLLGRGETGNAQELMSMWRDITGSMGTGGFDREEQSSAITELSGIADLLGCAIVFDGDFPQDNSLLLAAVREALTNAVRHAGADRLTVRTVREQDEIQVEISDNGKERVTGLTEGGGLSSLRQRVEASGGRMELCCRDGVVLKLAVLGKEEWL